MPKIECLLPNASARSSGTGWYEILLEKFSDRSLSSSRAFHALARRTIQRSHKILQCHADLVGRILLEKMYPFYCDLFLVWPSAAEIESPPTHYGAGLTNDKQFRYGTLGHRLPVSFADAGDVSRFAV
jgi:hypothetical protein